MCIRVVQTSMLCKLYMMFYMKRIINAGACWAFSAVAAIEGINKIKGGNLTTLSEQMLVDCDINNDDTGCHGGIMEKAYEFIIKNGGIATEDDYPYVARDKDCNKLKAKEVAVKIKEYKKVPENDEKSLQAAVAKQPVSVAIHTSFSFKFYSNGVFSGSCGTNVNHAVTVVGYGEEQGRKYWIVKNSWGKDWGEDGYMKIKRGTKDKRGECGIATDCTYPVLS
jgi:C1A family cysteine protease